MLEHVAAYAPRRPRARAWIGERRAIFGWWMGSRALVLAASYALHDLRSPRGFFGHHIFDHTLGPLEAWDGVWYRLVAEHGYLLVPDHQSDTAFFPLYPLLLKLVALTGMPLGVAGVVLSNGLFLGALLAFDSLGRNLFGHNIGRRSTLLLAAFPLTYVCSMVYPESLVLLALALSGLFAVRGRWLACTAAAAVAGLARPEGVLLVLPLTACLRAQWKTLLPERRAHGIGAVFAAPAAGVSFPLYLDWALHDPFAWNKAQQAWGRSFHLDGIWLTMRRLGAELSRQPWAARDVAFCVITLALLAAAWRAGAPRAWIALGALVVLLPLASGSFESDARFGLLALPAYWGLAWLCRSRLITFAVLGLSSGLLLAATLTVPLVFP